jgi:hypothetical protein
MKTELSSPAMVAVAASVCKRINVAPLEQQWQSQKFEWLDLRFLQESFVQGLVFWRLKRRLNPSNPITAAVVVLIRHHNFQG